MRIDNIFQANIKYPSMLECIDYCHIHIMNIDYIKYIQYHFGYLPKRIENKKIFYTMIALDLEKNLIINLVVSKNKFIFVENNITYFNINKALR